MNDIKRYAAAGYPVLAVETYEEERLVRAVVDAFKIEGGASRHILLWDIIGGLRTCTQDSNPKKANDPIQLLAEPRSKPDVGPDLNDALVKTLVGNQTYRDRKAVLVLLDAHTQIQDPATQRMIRVMQPALKSLGHMLVMAAPAWSIPSDLRCDVTMVDFALPTLPELEEMLEHFIQTNVRDAEDSAYKTLILPEVIKTQASEALQGLTSTQVENAISLAVTTLTSNGGLNLDAHFVQLLFKEKVQQLRLGMLEYMPTENMPKVAGLTALRDWATTRKFSFTKAAREFGLPYPTGAVLVGVPGCGKTIMAGEIARTFNLPLFKLDIGRLFASKVGETESLTREVIKQMNSIGGAVILLDEMEKSLSKNATSGGGDSGTSSRMFGTLLNWLSTKTCPVFILATSNNIDALPPELTRVGRFDAIFWVDLPTKAEREMILKLNFKEHHQVDKEALPVLAEQTEGYTGAELVALVNETTLRWFGGQRQNHKSYYGFLLDNLHLVKPQQNGKEQMKQMRETVESRGWLRANQATKETTVIKGRKLALN